ncbi:UNVERIFIED_CONTAM: hypothetical protein Slati_4224800, partial [Sesamum latifolium]
DYEDVFPDEIPPGLPPIRGIEYQIDFMLEHPCQTIQHTGPIPRRPRRFKGKSKTGWPKVM